jgi:sarcosine oxidase subunit alpha
MMANFRITEHPILPVPLRENLEFFWNGKILQAKQGETIASALFANGVRTFGFHPKDHSAQGIYCANGQCAQCLVIKDGLPVKACMELVKPGCFIEAVNGLPRLPEEPDVVAVDEIEEKAVPVLIIGGGPAGLSAAIELGKLGVKTLLIDDKHRLGGKLVLQTHRFFGSISTVYAGTRGIDIATRLETELRSYPSVEVWLHSTAVAVFSDKKVGVLKDGRKYILVQSEILLAASGAREKSLAFKGNTIPGVYGAGAFQTLVNRDLIRPATKLFIVGGGNVGLIAGYHALQAGIQVVGLVEALSECGGYKVHRDKLARMGVPIYTSHTIVSANGGEYVESITIARVDEKFRPIPGSERSFHCDTILVAVGLDPVNEFLLKAREYNLPTFAAGDAEEIAEASAAIFSGKIKGVEIASALGLQAGEVPTDWYQTVEILKSKPGRIRLPADINLDAEVLPVIHCSQEIPCDPCASVCPNGLIYIDPKDIRSVPEFRAGSGPCAGCERCLVICPGLAITLVDYRKNHDFPVVSIPFEFSRGSVAEGDTIEVTDTEGTTLGKLTVKRVLASKANDRTAIIMVQAPKESARQIAGIRIQAPDLSEPLDEFVHHVTDDTIICRCERVSAGEIRALIKQGYRDINEIKAVARAGMGACGAKTCLTLIHRLFREEGISPGEVVDRTLRPFFIEVPLGIFAGIDEKPGGGNG